MTVQKECSIEFSNAQGKIYSIKGRADVIKDNIVYELKFISELSHEHFLQCASYMIALGLEKGILWNIQNNVMYEITIPNRAEFIKCVITTITKNALPKCYVDEKYCNVASIT